MAATSFVLPERCWPKGRRYMRELRRAVEAYWYATMEDPEAAALKIRRVVTAVNVLDEAVFQNAFGDAYKKHRAQDPLGKVVMGLELIRNCEEQGFGAHFSRIER
ncbi:hypothetical protein [Streptomyces sp. ADI92-24]|uniref:hypothetical protein n=1 Tax=Streptomyces sp. ADI92-24 TaxID=1522756 RepID=UPI000F55996F|nr:hypothetical protein [Streptomyces sp. ADI92-24]